MIRLLVIDDSALIRRLFAELFAKAGDFELAYARNGIEALAQLNLFRPDVITLDFNMPEMNGLDCLDKIMIERPCPVVMVSSLTAADAALTLEAMSLGAIDFIPKPLGAISLHMEVLGPQLVERVRAAASARIPVAHRLAERVKARNAASGARPKARPAEPAPIATHKRQPDRSEMIVLVGTSTGGPPALDALLINLPEDFPCPVLIAQHMPASFTGSLARRLDQLCSLNVVEVTQPMPIARGHVYIGKGDADMIVGIRPSGLVVLPAPPKAELHWHPSVDRLVTSAALHIAPERLIGILMTGMGNDGAASLTKLRENGGHTIAEAEETAVVWGMPGELVRAGGAEIIAPLPQIAARLMDLVRA